MRRGTLLNTPNEKESLIRYIKSQIIAAKPVSLCFEDRVVSVQGEWAKVLLKDLLIELNYEDFRELLINIHIFLHRSLTEQFTDNNINM